MSDLKLFKLAGTGVIELEAHSVAIEKSLQGLIEKHLSDFLGVTFLASEYSTGKLHGGRIDTLGIDENGCPVIIEYKRATNENVINQGLFYLDWLMDHKAELELLVLKQMGNNKPDSIEWGRPRLICIAGDFTKYDAHAVAQINRSIELIRYRRYGDELVLFELVNAIQQESTSTTSGDGNGGRIVYKTVTQYLEQADTQLQDLFGALKAHLEGLGDDVQMTALRYYIAFKRIKNFACVEVHPKSKHLLVFAKVDPKSIQLEKGFTRDVSEIGHFGTGDLEITIRTDDDLKKAIPLLEKSYEVS